MSQCSDHLGNEYPSQAALARAYGLLPSVLKTRLARGWDLQEALIGRPRKDPKTVCYDHLGNRFPSKSAMAKEYGITLKMLLHRQKKGMSLEDALTQPHHLHVTDPQGNRYESKKAMLEAYGICYRTYLARIAAGYSPEEALTAKPGTLCYKVRDYKGKEYPSITAMLKAYKVPASTYYVRKRNGCSEKECLLGREKSQSSKSQIMENKKCLKAAQKKAHHHLNYEEDAVNCLSEERTSL